MFFKKKKKPEPYMLIDRVDELAEFYINKYEKAEVTNGLYPQDFLIATVLHLNNRIKALEAQLKEGE